MPSPFPGMDPFVEGVCRMNLHHSLSAEIQRQLAPKLRPKYVALLAERTVRGEPDEIAIASDTRYPDVGVYEARGGEAVAVATAASTASGTIRSVLTEPIPHVTVEIRDVDGRRLVTAIEVLSPTNKRSRGRRQYHQRRERLLVAGVHLVEIDLLREGSRIRFERKLPAARYFVFLTRTDRSPLTEYWGRDLPEPLPVVPVPLLAGDADVELDLQRAFSAMYDTVGYDLLVDYAREPTVPVNDVERAFIDECLRNAGIRT